MTRTSIREERETPAVKDHAWSSMNRVRLRRVALHGVIISYVFNPRRRTHNFAVITGNGPMVNGVVPHAEDTEHLQQVIHRRAHARDVRGIARK